MHIMRKIICFWSIETCAVSVSILVDPKNKMMSFEIEHYRSVTSLNCDGQDAPSTPQHEPALIHGLLQTSTIQSKTAQISNQIMQSVLFFQLLLECVQADRICMSKVHAFVATRPQIGELLPAKAILVNACISNACVSNACVSNEIQVIDMFLMRDTHNITMQANLYKLQIG